MYMYMQLLCERLDRVYHQAVLSIHEETEGNRGEGGRERKETNMAVKLGLKKMRKLIHVAGRKVGIN